MTDQLTLPKGQSFNGYIQSKLQEERQEGLEPAYPIDPLLDSEKLADRVWRFDRSGLRFYYNPDTGYFYPSQTSVQDATLKKAYHLLKWIDDMGGLENANAYRDERSDYGNLMHILFTEFLFLESFDLDAIPEIVKMYRSIYELWHYDTDAWVPELQADLSAFAQWVYDHEVEPIAIEIPITYPIYDSNGNVLLHVGGTIDLVANITVERKGDWGETYVSGKKKGQTKLTKKAVRERGVIDYKSGKKGFYKGHEIQVDTYMGGWNHKCDLHEKELHADSCWNFAPKDSRGDNPTYSFVEQTEKQGRKYMPHLVNIFMLDGNHEVKDVRNVKGKIEKGGSATGNVEIIPAEKYMKQKYEQRES